MVMGT